MYNFHKRKTSEGHIDFRHKLFRRNQEYTSNNADNFFSGSNGNPARQISFWETNSSDNSCLRPLRVLQNQLRKHPRRTSESGGNV